MAVTNRDRVGSAMDALKEGLVPFVSHEFINRHKGHSSTVLQQVLGEPVHDAKGHFLAWTSQGSCGLCGSPGTRFTGIHLATPNEAW